jgi:type II secretory pathway pseudopilin PulG
MSKETKRGVPFVAPAKKGFTIIELLTVMSIIILLIAILVPAMNKTRIFAKKVTQNGQFHEIKKALELFRNDHQDTLPDSGATDSNGTGYCGAMKLCEALLGQDGMGYHPSSSFQALQTGTYLFDLCVLTDPTAYGPSLVRNLQERTKYLDPENIKAYKLQNIYNWSINTGAKSFYPPPSTGSGRFDATLPNAVIGDMFMRTDIKNSCPEQVGKKAGMPVLYYKADPSKLANDVNTPPDSGIPNDNVYNFDDNYAITALGCPWENTRASEHPMSKTPALPQEPGQLRFYREIMNTKVTSTPKPHNEDGYILMSAGYDGQYGTRDDVFNFSE